MWRAMKAAEETLDDGARDELQVPDPGQDGRIEELDAGRALLDTQALRGGNSELGTGNWEQSRREEPQFPVPRSRFPVLPSPESPVPSPQLIVHSWAWEPP